MTDDMPFISLRLNKHPVFSKRVHDYDRSEVIRRVRRAINSKPAINPKTIKTPKTGHLNGNPPNAVANM